MKQKQLTAAHWLAVSLTLVFLYPVNPALAEGTEGNEQPSGDSGAREGRVNLEKITVTEKPESYRVLESSTPSRLNIPLKELPFSVGIVTRPVIGDRRTVLIQDTYKNVSGVIPVANITAGQQGVGATIRGFTSGSEFYVNGFRQQAQQALTGSTGHRQYRPRRRSERPGRLVVRFRQFAGWIDQCRYQEAALDPAISFRGHPSVISVRNSMSPGRSHRMGAFWDA